LGAGTGTVRQPAGAAPPDAAVLVVLVDEPAAAPALPPVDVLVLVLALLPQPASTNTVIRARQVRRTDPKQTRSAHWELERLSPLSWPTDPPPPFVFMSP